MLQYIGARYVPIFYQNSLDPTSSEWEPNVTYEPLTWVEMLNGYMYISKKTVPANIGSPASNPDYWMEAGQYNAYIQNLQDQIDDMKDGNVAGSLQNQIDDIDNDITTINGNITTISGNVTTLQNQIKRCLPKLTDRKFVVIGDSYAETYESGGNTITGWVDFLINQQGLTSDNLASSDIYRSSGTGFWAPLGTMAWKGWVDSKSVNTAITDVVIAGGDNDIRAGLDGDDLKNAIVATIGSVKTKFPNARIWTGWLAWDLSVGVTNNMKAAKRTYYDVLPRLGCIMMDGVDLCLMDKSLMLNASHPDVSGNSVIAGAIATALQGGSYHANVIYQAVSQSVDATKATAASGFYSTITDNILTLESDPTKAYFEIAFVTQNAYVCDGTHAIAYATTNDLPLVANDIIPLYSGPCIMETTGGWGNAMCMILYWHGYFEALVMCTNGAGDNYAAVNLNRIRTPRFKTEIDLFAGKYTP